MSCSTADSNRQVRISLLAALLHDREATLCNNLVQCNGVLASTALNNPIIAAERAAAYSSSRYSQVSVCRLPTSSCFATYFQTNKKPARGNERISTDGLYRHRRETPSPASGASSAVQFNRLRSPSRDFAELNANPP